MFTCKKCGTPYHWYHSCPGFVIVREPFRPVGAVLVPLAGTWAEHD